MRQRLNRSKQKGVTLIGVLLAVIIASVLMSRYANVIADSNHRQAIDIQGQRLANVVNAVVRYQSSGGNPPALLSPLAQWNVAGQPFVDGAVHTGLDWLKSAAQCGGATSAPSDFIQCNVINTPNLGENTMYRFVVTNDGAAINTQIQIVQTADINLGILREGNVDLILAAAIANNAEPRVMFTSQGATNTMFQVDRNSAIVSANVGLNVANTPYLRADGLTPSFGTQRFLDGADIEGVETLSAERLADYDRATDTVSTTRFIDMDGTSSLEDLETVSFETQNATVTGTLTTPFIDADGAEVNIATIEDLNVDYINQTNPNVQNQISGEIKVGTVGSEVEIGNGNIGLDGVVYNRTDNSYFLDLSAGGTTRLDDIVLTSLGNRSISELMPKMSLRGTKQVAHNDLLPMPNCASSGTPRLLIDPIRWSTLLLSTNGVANLDRNINYIGATVSGANWQISFTTHNQDDASITPDINGLGLAQVYCYYP